MVASFEREVPGRVWSGVRQVVEKSNSLSGLRTVLRELRSLLGALSQASRDRIEQELLDRCGPDEDAANDASIVQRVRKQGRIRSEREYRVVQSYADSINGDQSRNEEFLVLVRSWMGTCLRRHSLTLVKADGRFNNFFARICLIRPQPD
jgi:hypothetical protein